MPHMTATTFEEYAELAFIPFLLKSLSSVSRVDVVWDRYVDSSLKEYTREKRGKGVRRKISNQSKIPGNWAEFLKDVDNKKELTTFLTDN